MNPARLLTQFDRLIEAPDAVPRLRRFILDLAVRGKLVEQDPNDEPASDFGVPEFVNGKDRLKMVLPSGWSWAQVADVADARLGKMLDRGKNLGKPYQYLRNTNVQWFEINTDDLKTMLIEDEEIDKFVLRDGDVLICEGGHPGRAAVWRGELPEIAFQKALHRIRPKALLNADFFTFCLAVYFRAGVLEKYYTGVGIPHFTGVALAKLTFPLPPLAEQRRIVAKVNELMALCDRLEAAQTERESRRDRLAAASLHRLNQPADAFRDHARFHLQHLPRLTTRPEQITQLRQTILNLAVRGKLVPQDPNDEPASKLLKRIHAEKEMLLKDGKIRKQNLLPSIDKHEEPFELPAKWQWVRFGELIRDSDAGWSPRTESFPRSGENWGVVKVSAVTWGQFLPEENKQLLPGVTPPLDTQIHGGDFLISRANTSDLIAKCVIVEAEPKNLTLSDKTVRLDITAECNKWFLRIINNHAEHARSYYAKEASGTSLSMKNVSRPVIYILAIPLPPLTEQRRIVAKVEELLALCDRLETQLTTTQTESRRLLETVLQDALAPALQE